MRRFVSPGGVGYPQIGNEGGGVGASVVGTGAAVVTNCAARGDGVGILDGIAVVGGCEGMAVVGTLDGARVGTTDGRAVVGGSVGIRGAGIWNRSQPQPADDHSNLQKYSQKLYRKSVVEIDRFCALEIQWKSWLKVMVKMGFEIKIRDKNFE